MKVPKRVIEVAKLYHEAGDSICCTCLMAIFGQLFGVDYQTKINNFKSLLPYGEHCNYTNIKRMVERIKDFISDCGLEETMREYFADELKEWAQERYDNG